MKRKILYTMMAVLLILSGIMAFTGCDEGKVVPPPVTMDEPVPGAEASSLIPTANNTYDVGTNTKRWRDIYVGRYLKVVGTTITWPGSGLLVGTTDIQTLTNKTLTTPTISGTPVCSNHASGISTNLTAGSGTGVSVTHGMASTPTRVYLSWAGNPGASPPALYASSIGATTFTISLSSNVTNGVQVYWLAYIADE